MFVVFFCTTLILRIASVRTHARAQAGRTLKSAVYVRQDWPHPSTCFMMAQISAQDVASEVGLAADELSKPCNNSIIPSLADCFSQWRVTFGSLLGDLDLGDVDRENPTEEEKRIAALRKWKARNGYKATYKVLVDGLLNKGERCQAENLCGKILRQADHLSLSDKKGK